MISKAQRGHDMGGLVRYLFGPGRAEEHTNQRIVAAADPTWVGATQLDRAGLRQLVAELEDPMTRFGDTTRAGYVYHVVVSLPAEDGALSDARWQRTAQRFADKLGFDDQVAWVAVNHGRSTNGNDHIHFVANLMRADGRAEKLSYDRMRRREACIELEEEFGLTATAPAGMGQTSSLSRHEVEQLRAGTVAGVADLTQHRIATVVRAIAAGARSEPEFVERLRGEGLVVRGRRAKNSSTEVTGYSVAARGKSGERLIWYGGGRLGKDLRLPALRTKWGQSDEQRKAAASAWFSDAARRRKAEGRNLAGAANALREATSRLQKVPPADRFSWYVAANESSGLLAAAATTTTDDRLRRELIKAWQAIHRAVPTQTSLGREIAPGDAAQLRVSSTYAQMSARPTVAWTDTPVAPSSFGEDVSALVGGAARVLMAARLADAPAHVRVQALVVQAIQLAAQIARTIAAHQDAGAAQRRAAEATAAAAATAGGPHTGGWRFAKSDAEVLEAARAEWATIAQTRIEPTPAVGHNPVHPGAEPGP